MGGVAPLCTGVRLVDLDLDGKLDMVAATLSATADGGGPCGTDHAEAGAVYCASDVLGANAIQQVGTGAVFYDQGIAVGDLHEPMVQSPPFEAPPCSIGRVRFAVPIPDPSFGRVNQVSVIPTDGGTAVLRSGQYAVGPTDRMLYLAGGVQCGSRVEITYGSSHAMDIATATTDALCSTSTISVFFRRP